MISSSAGAIGSPPTTAAGAPQWLLAIALVALGTPAGAADPTTVPPSATAAAAGLELVVTSTGNEGDDDPGDGVCRNAAGFCTLRAAVEEANAWPGADVITLQSGSVPVPGGVPIGISDDVTIRSHGGVQRTISGQSVSPLFVVSGSAYPDVTFVDLELAYALSGEVGSAVWVESGGDLTFTRCWFSNNTSLAGGAIGIDGESGDVLVESCVFADNPTPGYSGGGPLANRGGAIHISGTPIWQRGALTVRDTTFNFNRGVNGGGAIALLNTYWDLAVYDSTFVANGMDAAQPGDGGAVEILSSATPILRARATFRRTSFTYNTASAGRGGAIAATDADVRLVDCTLADNFADWGGAVAVSGGQLALSMVTLRSNGADVGGGGIFAADGAAVLAAAAVLDANSPDDCAGAASITGDHNLASDASCPFSGSANLSSTDPLLGPGTGTPWTVHFDPQPGSPALDSAGPGPCLDAFGVAVGVDQTGAPRPADGDGDGLVRCDRGAREVPPAGQTPLFADGFEEGDLERWSSHAA